MWDAVNLTVIESNHLLACEYSRLSFAPATTCESRRVTSAIRGQQFHTDDVNLSRIVMGTNVAAGNQQKQLSLSFATKA